MADAAYGSRAVLVVGAGMAGLSAAVETAEAGFQVILVEREPYLGGRVAGMNRYFPKLCPPGCVTSPLDAASWVQNATAAALKAVQVLSTR